MSRATIAATMIFLLALFALLGCDSAPDAAQGWTHHSQQAPYQLTLPSGWRMVEPGPINPFADLVARHDDEGLWLMVIPQNYAVARPGLAALADFKEARLAAAQESIGGWRLVRQGTGRLDGKLAFWVMGQGRHQRLEVTYGLTFALHQGRAYQIVAWAPLQRHEALGPELDRVLGSWRFGDTTPEG